MDLYADGGIEKALCSCPYTGSGYCKHIVAVLLTVLQDEDEVAVKPELATLLADLTDTQLRHIILAVAEDQPTFAEAIEREVRWLSTAPAAGFTGTATPAAHSIDLDITAIRREISKDFRRIATPGGRRYRGDYDDYDDEGIIDPDPILEPHRQLAEALLDAGDAARATEVITAMIEEWGIKHCRRQAEGIMNAGKADAYRTAASWLRSARDTYLQHNRQAEWQSFLAGLLDLHARKYKLVPLLRELR